MNSQVIATTLLALQNKQTLQKQSSFSQTQRHTPGATVAASLSASLALFVATIPFLTDRLFEVVSVLNHPVT